MLITQGGVIRSGVRRRTIQRKVSFGPVSLRIATVIIFAAIALATLAHSAALATNRYTETELAAKVSEGKNELQEMAAVADRLSSLQEITKAQAADGIAPAVQPTPTHLEESKQINYLPASLGSDISQAPADTVRP